MTLKTLSEDVMVRFLLDELAEEERQEFEERFFLDDGLHDQLRAVETDLVDGYVRGTLDEARRRRFERAFLASPERRRRVENALALKGYISSLEAEERVAAERVVAREETRPTLWQTFLAFLSPQRPAMQYAMAGLVLALTAGGAWLVYDGARLRREVAEARGEQSESRRRERELSEQEQRLVEREHELEGQIAQQSGRADQLEGELKAAQEQRDQLRRELESLSSREAETPNRPTVLSFILTPGLTRGGGGVYTIPRNTASVRVHLPLPESAEEFKSYDVTVSTERGEHLWSRGGLRPTSSASGKTLVVGVPPRILREGRNLFTVRGTSGGEAKAVAVYPFDVTKK